MGSFRRNDMSFYVHLDKKGRADIARLNKLSVDDALNLVDNVKTFTLGYFRKALYDKHQISTPHLKFLVKYFERFPERIKLTATEKNGMFVRLEWVKVRVISSKNREQNVDKSGEEETGIHNKEKK